MRVLLVAVAVLLINIPFGYWRGNVKKFSLQWALAIHIPIPFIVLLRIYSNIGFALYTYPVLIAAFFLGQLAGKKIYDWRMSTGKLPVTSCLFMDLIKRGNDTYQNT